MGVDAEALVQRQLGKLRKEKNWFVGKQEERSADDAHELMSELFAEDGAPYILLLHPI